MKPLSNALRISAKRISWFVLLLLLLCAAPGWAANLTVTSSTDSGAGSLRATIAIASSGDVIYFASTLAGQTIHLTSGELSIGKNLTIDASGFYNGVILDGGGSLRVLEITAGTVVLAGLTLTNGSCPAGTEGGGILVDTGAALDGNSLTISSCFATNASVAGGIFVNPGASVSLVFSTISGCIATNVSSASGGAIYNDGAVVLEYCTLMGNTAGLGGGIYEATAGTLSLNDCTLVGNFTQSGGTGGAIYLFGSSTATLVNCTLSGNSSGNGGGIFDYTPGHLVLTNTIVAGNTATAGPDISGPYSGANNFIGGNPRLALLGNYGGPTLTMQPLSGSPVIDAGSDSVTSFLTYDQRTSLRLSGAHVDIGAVEVQFNTLAAYPPVLKSVTRAGNGFQFAFTNVPSLDFTALTSTNLTQPLTNWTALGNVTEISSGQYQFTDASATNKAHQFYRVVSP